MTSRINMFTRVVILCELGAAIQGNLKLTSDVIKTRECRKTISCFKALNISVIVMKRISKAILWINNDDDNIFGGQRS